MKILSIFSFWNLSKIEHPLAMEIFDFVVRLFTSLLIIFLSKYAVRFAIEYWIG